MSQERRHPHITHLADVPERTEQKGSRFGFRAKRLGPEVGARQLGCSWFEVEPGRTAFPHHYHCANEEAMFVLEGEGTLRIGEARYPVGAGDYIAFPAGPEAAHSITNTGSAPLRYLCLSTLHAVEIVGYVDSKKFLSVAAKDPSRGFKSPGNGIVHKIFPDEASLDYYEGEDIGD